ncbi:copper amine oxidase [Lysobacter capsici]|nr:copper amine oxidase [Lysobacter capsici]
MLVHKSPTCGCCGLWVDRLRQAGFPVEVRDQDNIHPIKERLGIPFGKGSCHTAQIDGYVIEGHVPVEDIKRLLAERPQARGLTLPGMPAGSPGMEMPDGRVEPYTVELIATDGSTRPFAQHGGAGSR